MLNVKDLQIKELATYYKDLRQKEWEERLAKKKANCEVIFDGHVQRIDTVEISGRPSIKD